MASVGKRIGMARGGRVVGLLDASVLVGILLVGLACAATQKVPLDLRPIPAQIFVDGKKVKGMPNDLELRVDRDHKVFVKSEGYRSELVVLRTRQVDGENVLEPSSIQIRLAPLVHSTQEVQIEVEEDEVEEASDGTLVE